MHRGGGFNFNWSEKTTLSRSFLRAIKALKTFAINVSRRCFGTSQNAIHLSSYRLLSFIVLKKNWGRVQVLSFPAQLTSWMASPWQYIRSWVSTSDGLWWRHWTEVSKRLVVIVIFAWWFHSFNKTRVALIMSRKKNSKSQKFSPGLFHFRLLSCW